MCCNSYPYIAEKGREIDQNCTGALHWWNKSMLCIKYSVVTPKQPHEILPKPLNNYLYNYRKQQILCGTKLLQFTDFIKM